MQPWVIDLSDARVSVADDTRLLASSPGYAIALPGTLLLGAAAFSNACAHPRQTISTFFSQLSADVIKVPGAPDRSMAEYVHAHLNDIVSTAGGNATTPVILAAPAHFDRDRLALLLGIAAQCQFRPVGLVDAAVAAAASAGRSCLHVDVGLHHAVISYLITADGHLQHAGYELLTDIGWVSLRAELTRVLSAAFVHATRFDPLRHADTEQQLHTQLTDLLSGLIALPSANELAVVCRHAGQLYPISIDVTALAAPLLQRQLLMAATLQRLAPRGTPILLSPMAALVPGLSDVLATVAPVTALNDTAVARGALAHRSQIEHGGTALPFVRRLQVQSSAPHDELPLPAPHMNTSACRHFALHGSQLYALDTTPLQLMQGDGGSKRSIQLADGPALVLAQVGFNGSTAVLLRGEGAGVTVNGTSPAAVVALATGDVIRAADSSASQSTASTAAIITIVELAAERAR